LADAAIALKNAEQCYDRAIALRPNYLEAILNKGSLFMQSNRMAQAIPLLLSVLKISNDKYDSSNEKIKTMSNEPIDVISSATIERQNARQDFIKVAPKIIDVLKKHFIKEKDYQGYLEILEYNFKLMNLLVEEKKEQFVIVSKELDARKNNVTLISNGITMEMLESRVLNQKESYEKALQDAETKIAKFYLEKGDILRILNLYDKAVAVYKQVQELKDFTVQEQKSLALLKINEIYINIAGHQLPDYYNEIETNFKNATYKDNPATNEAKANLIKAYNELKNK